MQSTGCTLNRVTRDNVEGQSGGWFVETQNHFRHTQQYKPSVTITVVQLHNIQQ